MDETLVAQAKEQSALCRLFSNPRRLLILWSLADGELGVTEIAARVGSSLQNISQHLRMLKGHGVIVSRRNGQHIYYRINQSPRLINCLAVTTTLGNPLVLEKKTNPLEAVNGNP